MLKNSPPLASLFHLFLTTKNLAYGQTQSYGLIFVSSDFDPYSPFVFSTTLADHTENTMFLKSAKQIACWNNFIKMFELGLVRFENIKIKNICNQLIKKIIVG